MQDLVKHMTDAGITGSKVGAFITDAFGKKSSSSLAVLVEQFARFESKYKDVSAQAGNFSNAWAQQQKQFKQQWDDLTASLQVYGVKLGNWLIPKIQAVIDWLGKHKEATKALEVAIGVGLVTALAAATAGMIAFTAALLTNPIFLIVAAVEALVIGVYELWTHWDQVWGWIEHHKAYAAVVLALTAVVAPFIPITIGLVWLAKNWHDVWTTIETITLKVVDGLLVTFKALGDGVLSAVYLVVRLAADIPGPWQSTAKRVRDSVSAMRTQFDQDTGAMITATHGLIASINAVPPMKRVTFSSDGVPNVVDDINRINTALDKIGNSYVVSVGGTGRKLIPGAADGMLVGGSGGPRQDNHIIAVSTGEAVVPQHLVGPIAPYLAAHGVPGFAAGGLIGPTNVRIDTQQIGNALVGPYAGLAGALGGGSVGGGAAQWSSTVLQVLGMLGLSALLLPKVLRQINTESGGNPNAINLTDSNALAGHPSMGVLQTIMPTFLAYAGAFAALGPFNGFADIYAGLNYAAHRYGPNLNGLGEGHGYAMGGYARGWAKVGEAGPEMVYLGHGGQVLSNRDSSMGGTTIVIQAVDAASIRQMLHRPGVAQEFVSAIATRAARG
jgi:hypothetical protein